MIRRTAIATTVLLFSVASWAEAPKVDALNWMTGGWVEETPKGKVAETWLGPGNGLMVAVNLTNFTNGRKSFEFLRIAETPEGFSYFASPGGQSPPTEFKLKEMSGQRVVFENAAHDFPQRVLYWREGDALHAKIEGTIQGKERSQQWKFARP